MLSPTPKPVPERFCLFSNFLGPYRGLDLGIFSNDPVIYDEIDYMTLPGTARTMTAGDIGDIAKAAAEGLPAHGSVRVRVFGRKKSKKPTSWTADVYSEKKKGYGWNKLSEKFACEKQASLQAAEYFRNNNTLKK